MATSNAERRPGRAAFAVIIPSRKLKAESLMPTGGICVWLALSSGVTGYHDP
jgi:hypothetical protein